MTQSLIIPRVEAAKRTHPEPNLPSGAAFWAALGLIAIGLVDAVFLWIPFRITEIAWRVGVIRATVDALPLATLGLTVFLIAAVRRQSNVALGAIVVLGGVVFLTLFALAPWFVASAMHLQKSGGQDGPATLEIVRTTIFAAIYLFVYATITGAAVTRMIDRVDHSKPI